MNPETRNTLVDYIGRKTFSHYHVSKELYFREVVLAETLVHTFVVATLSVHHCLHHTDSHGSGGENRVLSTVRFKCLQAARRMTKSSQPYLTWRLLPRDPVDAAAWKRPPREDSCSNSGCYVQNRACRYLDYMLGFCSKHLNSHARHFYTCVGISPEGLGNEMQLKNCLSPSAL